MRIERREHAIDRALDELVVVNRLHIAGLDPFVDGHELAELGAGPGIDRGKARCGSRN